MEINSTISLKMFSFGVQRLHDPNWTGGPLYDNTKQHTRQKIEPKNLLLRTLQEGFLYQLGAWIYDEYFFNFEDSQEYIWLKGESLLWYLEDYLGFLSDCGIDEGNESIKPLSQKVEMYNNLYNEDEVQYYESLSGDSEILRDMFYVLSNIFKSELEHAKPIYAQDFAERVFHDRILCEYISELLIAIGFDGTVHDGDTPQKWVDRVRIPNWAKRSVAARERGQCAECGASLVPEVKNKYHFDHIVPLYSGGTNDLCNLQLLCQDCNLRKSYSKKPVKTSVPRYLQIKNR